MVPMVPANEGEQSEQQAGVGRAKRTQSAPSENTAARNLVIIASLIVITAGLKAAGELITPILLSLFFAVLCTPGMMKLKAKGVPNALAITIVVLFATIVMIGIATIVGKSVGEFENKIPTYQSVIDLRLSGLFLWLQDLGINIKVEDLTSKIDSDSIFVFVRKLANSLGQALSQFFVVILTIIFMLFEAASFPSKLRMAMGSPDADLKNWGLAMEQVQKYVAIKAGVSLATALLATALTASIGVDFPLLWGLIAFLFNFIPNIGSIIAAVPPMLLAFVQFGGGASLVVGIGYLVINLVMGNVIEPRLMGKRLGLSTLVVFLSLIFWNWVWGPVGMILSVPLTVIVKIILEHSTEFRGLAIILGNDTSPNP